jgi:hypothetical protein
MLRISFENVNMMIQNPYWMIITGDIIYIYVLYTYVCYIYTYVVNVFFYNLYNASNIIMMIPYRKLNLID